MSIKKLFDSTNKSRNYLSDTDQKDAFESVESARNARAIKTTQDTFIPQVNYEKPVNFAKYGSAYLYYKSAIERIHDYYPYDGSDAEINEFYNGCLPIEQYLFDSKYPRTTGYITMSAGGWGSRTNVLAASGGYGSSSASEYITFYGGPNTITHTKLQDVFPNPYDDKYQYSNIYDTDIYTTEGLPTTYGSGSRESNLKSDFDKGVTVEFWFKTGSTNPVATYANKTQKEVIFDLWNNELSSSADYGRITIGINSYTASSPFYVTVQSGTAASYNVSGCFEQAIGTGSWTGSFTDDTYCLSSWKHYAFSMFNSGSDFLIKLHVDGELKDTYTSSSMTLGALNSKNMMGRIGGLLTAPSGTIGSTGSGSTAATVNALYAGAGKLEGALDEFRFWKVRRNSNEIARYWKSQVRGGTNTDISNTTLGVYYKFNEGITTDTTTDSIVLDYSGRVSNGAWTGYVASSRNTGSALVSSSARTEEYLDPIVYSTHPSVTSLKTDLLNKGEKYDFTNNSAFVNMMPSWVLEDDEGLTSDLRKMSHIVATYLDKLRLQIEAVPSFKGSIYTTASSAPLPFAQHLPQSLGLYTPDLFIDATVMEKFLNRDQDTFFEGDLTETKNLIYLNLYNNLASIYKAKGTEKAIKNVFRCFNMDDKLLRLKTYANNQVYDLQDNLKQYIYEDTAINHNLAANIQGVVYQRKEAGDANSLGYISGTYGRTVEGGSAAVREGNYGFTAEASIVFPTFDMRSENALVNREFLTSSLFGMHTIITSSNTSKLGTDTRFPSGSQDYANFQVLAIRDEKNSKNVRFQLSASNDPFAGQFTELTSSTFFNVYDNEEWHFSVRMKPTNYTLTNMVDGSGVYSYILEFRGVNAVLDTIQNSFVVTASIGKDAGQNFLQSAKRLYAGARRTNITGATLNPSDVLFGSMKYYAKYIEDGTLDQHLYNERNVGVSASYQNLSALDSSLTDADVLNSNTLALNWTFDNITSSNAAGNFGYVQDVSSGSSGRRNDHWIGGIAGWQHTGFGYGFATSSADIVSKDLYNALKFTDPEEAISSTMVQVLTNDDIVYGVTEPPPTFFHSIEKSMYNAISEEMLLFFAGAIDFHNIIGEPVNRYRERYKVLEKLRQTFFRRVTTVSTVEKFIDYYKWFDDAMALIIGQLLPASAELVEDVAEVVESHVLERNKYKTPFPTIEFVEPEPEPASMLGVSFLKTRFELISSPTPSSPRATNIREEFWKVRALRDSQDLSSSVARVNVDRQIIANQANVTSDTSASNFRTRDGTKYQRTNFFQRHRSLPYQITADLIDTKLSSEDPLEDQYVSYEYQGGTNFSEPRPKLDYFYHATRPAGAINRTHGAYVPVNVLLAPMAELVPWTEIELNPANRISGSKEKRHFKLWYGPDWDGGYGPNNVKNSIGFPFNIMSSSVSGGYNKQIVENLGTSMELTNLHHDVYGPEMERPMQGPFTEAVVGGHQSRHVALNDGTDAWYNRPEAWKILLGTCDTIKGVAGAIGVVGADYPWPESNGEGINPYPLTGAQKAVYYRGFTAKSPVNIRNIHLTGSALGNYSQNYEVVCTFGGYVNPRQFVENPPTLPTELTQTPSGTQARSFLGIRRTDNSHFDFVPDYSVGYLTASTGKSVILNHFAAPGSIETMGVGYKDVRASEFSAYIPCTYRNWSVRRPFQNMSSSVVSEATGSGTPGIRVSDVNGLDLGWDYNTMAHSAQFGRSSIIYPPDAQRTAYDLAINFMGYSETEIYRSSQYLQGWWRFRTLEPGGAGWGVDSSDKGRTGTFPTAADKPTYSGSLGPSKYVQTSSAGWDGGAERMNIGTAATWDALIGDAAGSTKQMTFAAWVYKTGDGGGTYGRIIDFGSGDVRFYTNNVESIYFDVTAWTGANAQWHVGQAFSLNTWTHIAVTYDAGSTANEPVIYVNGVAQTVTEDTAPLGTYGGIDTDACFVANNFDANRGFEGQLCDMGVWNSILTAEDVKAIYNQSKLPSKVGPGAINVQRPSMYKVNRNPRMRLKPIGYTHTDGVETITYMTASSYDNFYVQHQIPRADRQYAWVTASIVDAGDFRYHGMAQVGGPLAGYYSSSAEGYTAYFNFMSASSVLGKIGGGADMPIYQPANRLNIYVIDPVNLSTNTLGLLPAQSVTSSYNTLLLDEYNSTPYALNLSADYLNLLLTQRRSTFEDRHIPFMSPVKNHILQKHAQQSQITLDDGRDNLQIYPFKVASMRGRPVYINMSANDLDATYCFTWNNELLYCSDQTLNQKLDVRGDKTTIFDKTIEVADASNVFDINWILYSEMMFPSRVKEFTSASAERPNYDNKFWRTSATDRLSLGSFPDRTPQPRWYNLNGPDWNSTPSYSYSYIGQSSLQGWWRLNQSVADGGDFVDSSTHSRNGTSSAGGTPAQSTTLYPSKYIQTASCTFDASDDAINIGTAALWDDIIGNDTAAGSTELMTFSAWIYKTGDGGSSLGRIFDFGLGDLAIYTTATEKIYFNVKWTDTGGAGTNGIAYWTTPDNPFTLETWTHIAITYDATSTSNNPIIYVNGEVVALTEDEAPVGDYYGFVSQDCFIGNRAGVDRAFEGQIADVAIWNSVLSSVEIKALYNAKTGVYPRGTNSFGIPVSQSSWPLDAPIDFLTRTAVPYITPIDYSLVYSNSAGELQNTYVQIVSGNTPRGFAAAPALAVGGLLARKHTIATARSVVSPSSGKQISATGTMDYKAPGPSGAYNQRLAHQLYAGESEWQAGTQAGIIVKSGNGPDAVSIFESHSSAPFYYNSYADFIDEIRTVAKDYAIVPEFRISEHVDEYLKYGISANNKFDWAEIPGAYTDSGHPVDSSQPGFYKDYSNSEFAHHFLTLKNKTLTEPVEIMLEVNAAIRYNPYKGFYPQQRTLDLITQFSKSFGTSLMSTNLAGTPVQQRNGCLRPLAQALFAPGVLYNTIKSGLAVDYPVVIDETKVSRHNAYGYTTASNGSANVGSTGLASTDIWMITSTGSLIPPLPNAVAVEGYDGGQFWDYRVSFDDLLNPSNLRDLAFFDVEPHPSCSLSGITASIMAEPADESYALMASNFAAAIPEFFLKETEFTKLESEPVSDGLRFETGSVYGARLKLRCSKEGTRTYGFESGSSGNSVAYGRLGARVFDTDRSIFLDSVYPLPQDPRQNPAFQSTFTMESRPSSFGPPVSGRPTASVIEMTASNTRPADSMNGFNWSYTPPYYDGEAWVDFIFTPTTSTTTKAPVTYDLEKILSEIEYKYWRCDPGISASTVLSSSTNMVGTVLLPTFSGNCGPISWRAAHQAYPTAPIGSSETPLIYDGANINDNAMQLSASLNIFGIEKVLSSTKDKFGNQISTQNQTAGSKWVIQPKMETPMLNFSHTGSMPVSASTPLYGSASVSTGMWRQFGIIDPDPNKGIFMEIGPIPPQWLKNHYEVITYPTMYNGRQPAIKGQNAYRNIKPLTNVIKFKPRKRKARLGELAETKTIKEAIVIVPYKIDSSAQAPAIGGQNSQSNAQASKRFFGISRDRIRATSTEEIGSATGDSLDAAGMSIRELVKKMECYVLPPWADFLSNKSIDPFVMYMLEFEYEFDKDDLSYIYQGLAPRNSKNMTLTSRSTAHELNPTELMSAEDVLDPHLRWMVFKVKQRSMVEYEDIMVPQVGESSTARDVFDFTTTDEGYKIGYNWPYDYISFVESIKFDVKVLYKETDEQKAKKRRDKTEETSDAPAGDLFALDIESEGAEEGRPTLGGRVVGPRK